jgi:hypothetical protein
MTELVAVAIINGGFGVLVLLLGVRLNRKVNTVRADARATRYQVENNHIDENGRPINLREEADSRHLESTQLLTDLSDNMKRVRDSVGKIWERLDKHTDQIHDLELIKPATPTRRRKP